MSILTKPRLEVYCPDCGVCCVPDKKESRYSEPNRLFLVLTCHVF
ncbi:hypothetical protein ES703_33452 [subsurface metagenome]